MRHALRRLVWLIPALVASTFLAFALVAAGAGSTSATVAPTGAAGLSGPRPALPLFFNPRPRGVSDLAADLLASVGRDDASERAALGRLGRLGGAALPYLLPAFDELSPRQRARIALALAPVARRMGVGGPEELEEPDRAVLFWVRYWQDRSIDFRPIAARRAVNRVAGRDSELRRSEVRHLDTFALPELMDALVTPRKAEDVGRAVRLTRMLSQITERPDALDDAASVDAAAACVSRWHAWWRDTALDYVPLDGPRRLAAMLLETHYGRWATTAARSRLGKLHDGRPAWEVLAQTLPATLLLTGIGLLLGGLGGGLLGTLGALVRHRGASAGLWLATVTATSLPLAFVAPKVAHGGSPGQRLVTAAALLSAWIAAIVALHVHTYCRTSIAGDATRARLALGVSRRRLAWRTLRASAPVVAALLGTALPLVLPALFVLEQAFGLPGIGPTTIAALRTHDQTWLMIALVGCGATGGVLQIAADAWLALADRRVAPLLAHHAGLGRWSSGRWPLGRWSLGQ